ncbi:MAG TPA: hypothetical protein VM689_23990 [Aliidongia sp.]|nr:hypothetical protein [Aliidongia sp.]
MPYPVLRIRPYLCFALFAFAVLLNGPASAGMVPTDPEGFTAFVAKMFRAVMPDATVEVTGPLALSVKSKDGDESMSLTNVYSTCMRNAAQCDQIVAGHVSSMAASHASINEPVKRRSLRVIVRPATYIEAMKRNLAGRWEPVAAPLAGGYWMIAAADMPEAIQMVTTRDLPHLKLSSEEALEDGKKHLQAAMRRHIKAALKAPRPGISVLTNDPYASSLLAFPELWAPVADMVGGDLLVAVPSADVVLYSPGKGADAAKRLQAAAQEIMARADRVFTDTVFRWGEDGWTPVYPDAKRL